MSDLTSNLYLAIRARNLTQAGLASSGASLRAAAASQLSDSRMQQAQAIAAAREGARAQTLAIGEGAAKNTTATAEGARARTLAIREGAARDTEALAQAGRAQVTAARVEAARLTEVWRQAGVGESRATQATVRAQILEVRRGVARQTEAIGAATSEQIRIVRLAAAQELEATRIGATEQANAIRRSAALATEATRIGGAEQVAAIRRSGAEKDAAIRRSTAEQDAITSSRRSMIPSAGAVLMGGAIAAGVVAAPLVLAQHFQSMTQSVANNTTMTNADLASMRGHVLDLAAYSGASTDSIAQGYQHVTNYGYSMADATKIANAAIKSAVSTGANASDVFQTLGNVMHEYNIPAGQAARVMDTLHYAAAQGNMTLEQFVEQGGKAIGIAANLHVPVDQVAAAYAALTRHGQDPATAATNIVGMMSKIINPAKAARVELARLSQSSGIDLLADFTPAGLKAKGLTGVLHDLAIATHGNVAEIFQLIPALRGGQGAMALTGTGAKDYGTILTSLHGTITGRITPTIKAFGATQTTLAFQLERAKRQVEVLGIRLGTALLPAATQVATAFNGVLGKAIAFVSAHMASWQRTIGTVTRFLHDHARTIGTVAKAMLYVAAVVVPMVAAFRTVGIIVGIITAWRDAQIALNLAMAANPVGLVITAIVGLIAIAVIAYEKVGWFHNAVNGLWGVLKGPLTSAFQGVSALISGVVVPAFHAVWSFLSGPVASVIGTVGGALKGPLTGALRLVAGFLGGAWKVEWAVAVWAFHLAENSVTKILVPAMSTLWGWLGKVAGFLGSTFGPAISTITGTLRSVLGDALHWVSQQIQGLLGFFGKLLSLVGKIPGVHQAIQAVVAAGADPSAGAGSSHHHTVVHHHLVGTGKTALTTSLDALTLALTKASTPSSSKDGLMGRGDKTPRGHLSAATEAFIRSLNKSKKGVVGGHDYNVDLAREKVRYQGDRSRFGTNPLNAAMQRTLRDDIATIGRTERKGHLTDTTYALTQAMNAAIYHAEHRPGRHGKRGVVGGHDYAADETTDTNRYQADLALFRQGLLPETRILSDIAAISKDERAGHLTDRALRYTDDLKAYDQRQHLQAATQAQHAAHHAATTKAHTVAHQQRVDHTAALGRLHTALVGAQSQERHDKRFNRGAVPGDIARIVGLDRQYELLRTGSASQADTLAKALGQSLTDAVSTGTQQGYLRAHLASGLVHGRFGLVSRVTPGQAASYGTTSASFGPQNDALARMVRYLEEKVAQDEQTIAELRKANVRGDQQLVVETATRDATRTVASRITRPAPVAPDPFRSHGFGRPI